MSEVKLSFGVNGQTMDFVTEIHISAGDAGRLLSYLTEGSPHAKIVGQGGSVRLATPQEATEAFARQVLKDLLQQTVLYEQDMAAKAAVEAVTPISFE